MGLPFFLPNPAISTDETGMALFNNAAMMQEKGVTD